MVKKKLFKVLVGMKSCHGDKSTWKIGKWMPKIEDTKICEHGYHLTTNPYGKWFKWGCDVFEAEAKQITETKDDKVCCKSAHIVKKVAKPSWLKKTEKFVNKEIKLVPFNKPDGKPLKEWKHFEADTLVAAWDAARDAAWDTAWDAAWGAAGNAAWNAARDAARNAARDAARDAAWDATLYSRFLIISDLVKKDKALAVHWKHVEKRWGVYQKGYFVYCDVNGVLYTYGVKKSETTKATPSKVKL